VSVSGCGETLVKTHFAEKCCEAILEWLGVAAGDDQTDFDIAQVVRRFFQQKYLDSPLIANYDASRCVAGAIVAVALKNGPSTSSVELVYVHNSRTFSFGYVINGQQPRSVFSRSNHGQITVGGMRLKPPT